MTENIQAYLRLLRVDRALSASFAVLFSGLIAQDLTCFQHEYLVACLTVLFAAFANFALNDYYDEENDRLNHREDRPLVQGAIPRGTVLKLAMVFSAAALLLTVWLNPVSRFLILAGLPLSLTYHLGVKKVLILKNASIGFTNVGIMLLGSLVTDGTVEPVVPFFAVIGFFAGLSYEVLVCFPTEHRRGFRQPPSLLCEFGPPAIPGHPVPSPNNGSSSLPSKYYPKPTSRSVQEEHLPPQTESVQEYSVGSLLLPRWITNLIYASVRPVTPILRKVAAM